MECFMWTRQQYMSHKCTHDEYYLEIAKECGISLVNHPIAKKCQADNDNSFNRLTELREWDVIAAANQSKFMKACKARGDQYSLASGVCILKAMAKHEKELGLYDHLLVKSDG